MIPTRTAVSGQSEQVLDYLNPGLEFNNYVMPLP